MNNNNNSSSLIFFANSFEPYLCNLLSTIKLDFQYYSAYHNQLTALIQTIEELLLLLNSPIQSLPQPNNGITSQNETKLYELFYLSLTITTNSTFYNLFLRTFQKFIKQITTKAPSSYVETYSHFLIEILDSLLKKQITFIGVPSDSLATLNHIKTISMLIDLFSTHNIQLNNISISEIFKLYFEKNDYLFSSTKTSTHLHTFSKLIRKAFKSLVNGNIKNKDIFDEKKKILHYLMNMIISISKKKETSVQQNIDHEEDSFLADTLIICIKLLKKYFKNENNKQDLEKLPYVEKLKLTKCFVELSFWDNPKIVDATCELFYLVWKVVCSVKGFEMRKEIEVVIQFIYLRRFKDYYEYINKYNEFDYNNTVENDIKLFVVETLARHFNKVINYKHSFIALYILNDLTKIRFNIVNELLLSIQKYFSIKNDKVIYIQQTFLCTLHILFNKIQSIIKIKNTNEQQNKHLYGNIDGISDKWVKIIEKINEAKYKSLYNHLLNEFNFGIPYAKPQKDEKITQLQLSKYHYVSKSIALLIRCSSDVDIDKIYETIGDNHALSKCILEEFSQTFNFEGYDFIKAYELYVSSFKITGEQFHIYNFICNFSKKYFNDNKHLPKEKGFHFTTEEEVIAFAYSTMMLNTDLHNPNVTNHMTCEEFLKNNLSYNLYKDLPEEYVINIYNRIQASPLKAANQRKYNFSKEEELYKNLKCLQKYKTDIVTDYVGYPDILSLLQQFPFNKSTFPLINIHDNLYIPDDNNVDYSCLSYAYQLLFEDLFCNVLALPQQYFASSNQYVFSLINTICDISIESNKKDIIGKIITTLSSITQNSKYGKPYMLFFHIAMKYKIDFHLFLDIYYQTILDVLSIKLNENKNPLRIEYMKFIDDIIYKTFFAINTTLKKQNENYSFMSYFFGSSTVENEFTYDKYKLMIYNKLDITIEQPSQENENSDNESIDLENVFNTIKNEQEQFMFFVSLATTKLIEFQNKKEFYLSFIFLKEILKGISQKDFLKIWQNLNGVFKARMEFKTTNKENEYLFDLLYTNFFMHQILSQYFVSIENEDYYILLENYLTVDSSEILFIILENNNNLILKAISQNKAINDNNFDILIKLIHKLIILSPILKQGIDSSNLTPLTNFIKTFDFLTNIIQCYHNYSSLSLESIHLFQEIITAIYDPNIVNLLITNNFNFMQIFTFVETLTDKLISVMPNVNDNKYKLYIYIAQFCFKCSLNINEQVQMKFIGNITKMFNKERIVIPFVKYAEILNILSNWHEPFVNLRKLYSGCWKDVFEIFYCLLSNNDGMKTHFEEMEKWWILFIRKYTVSYVDQKKCQGFIENIDECEKNLIKVYEYVRDVIIGNEIKDKPQWWESTKNTIRLYFSNLMK